MVITIQISNLHLENSLEVIKKQIYFFAGIFHDLEKEYPGIHMNIEVKDR